MTKYRRIKKNLNSQAQAYQLTLVAWFVASFITFSLWYLRNRFTFVHNITTIPYRISLILLIICFITVVYGYSCREKVSKIKLEKMSKNGKKLSRRIKRLFNDKQITDVLKLSNNTRYGDEMPEIEVYVNDDMTEGFISIENIANFERANREKFEQRISGILSGKYQKFAIVSSELKYGDTYIFFYFEDTLTSMRFNILNKDISSFVDKEYKQAIRLSKDLVWKTDITSHLSIIARTRSGKSVFAGDYLAQIMINQGWLVEYNSCKYDRYVKKYNGQSDPIKIVERAEYWCSIMDKRLKKINLANKDKYIEMDNMSDVSLFFDELGNLNASLESLDKLDKSMKVTARWTTAINRLSATGASAGIHIIAISQFDVILKS